MIGRNKPSTPAYDSNGNYCPTGVDDQCLWYNGIPPLVNNRSYYSLIADYMYNGIKTNLPVAGQNNIWVCPSASSPDSLAGTPGSTVTGLSLEMYVNATSNSANPSNYFGLWGTDQKNGYTPRNFPFFMCYAFNSKLFASLVNGTNITHVKLAQLRPGSDVVLMCEKITNYGDYSLASEPECYHYYPNPSGSPQDLCPQGYMSNIGQPKATNTRFTTRHRHGGYILFADGHVSWFAWTQVQGIIDNVTQKPDTINRPDSHVIWNPFGMVQ